MISGAYSHCYANVEAGDLCEVVKQMTRDNEAQLGMLNSLRDALIESVASCELVCERLFAAE
jgi:hypothetical protein